MSQPGLLLLLLAVTAAALCRPGSCLASFYKGGEGNPVYRFLSDHAFLVRRNRIVPPVMVQYTEQADAASLQSGAASLRAVLLPDDDEALLARFAEAAGTGDKTARRRLFIGVSVRHSTKRFTAKRFLRILELLRTSYLDLLLISGRPCDHSQRDRLACGRNRLTGAFLHNWRNLLRLARKRRVLSLGLRRYPLTAVRALHRISTPECLDFPSRSTCSVSMPGGKATKAAAKDDGAQVSNSKDGMEKKKKLKQKAKSGKKAASSRKVDMHSAYSMRRAAGNVNFLTVVQATFNPYHRHRVLRRWCHRHSVVLLADEALGGPHAADLLGDARLTSAAAASQVPVRAAVLHWALKKRVAVAVGSEDAAEFGSHLGVLSSKTQHLAMIDATAKGDMETRYFLVPSRRSAGRIVHNEL